MPGVLKCTTKYIQNIELGSFMISCETAKGIQLLRISEKKIVFLNISHKLWCVF